MSQHDYSIANQGFPSFRADLNDALEGLVTNSSGATAPSTTFAHQFWVDTAANPSVLKIRNADNNAWIVIGEIDQTGDAFVLTSDVEISGGTIDDTPIGASTPSTGVFTDLTASGDISLGGYPFSESNMAGRNRIINGDMRIDARNAGASVTPTTDGQYGSCDRWSYFLSQTSKFSVQQNAGAVTPPAGFTNYLGVTSLSAYSVVSGDAFVVRQGIEGFNVADLGWGTANAQTVTLSFWVRSSLTGAFGGSFYNGTATRSYPFTFTVSAANTWEQKTITVPGDTTGTWATDNTAGVNLRFSLGAGATFSGTAGAWAAGNIVQPTGSVSVVGTSGATFYLTGVQLEAGSVATPFERRPYSTELQLAQRYYEQIDVLYMTTAWTTVANQAFWKVTKRAIPTLVNYPASGSGGQYNAFDSGAPTGVGLNHIFQTHANSAFAGGWVSGSSEL